MQKALLSEHDDAKPNAGYQRTQDMMEASSACVFITHGINAAIYRDAIVPATLPDGTARIELFCRA